MSPITLNPAIEALDRLHQNTVALQAEVVVWEMRADEAQSDYQRGKSSLQEVQATGEEHLRALHALNIHRAAIADLEAQMSEVEKAARIESFGEELRAIRAQITEKETAMVVTREAQERQAVAVRLAEVATRQEVAQLVQEGRNKLAHVAHLLGEISTVTHLSSQFTSSELDAYESRWRLFRLHPEDRPDVPALQFIPSLNPETAAFDHENRWRDVLRLMADWSKAGKLEGQ